MSPRAADVVRKALGAAMAVGLTLLTFRVLSRLADGRQRLLDAELAGAVVLAFLGFLWVRWARRVSAARPWREPPPLADSRPADSRPGPRSGPPSGLQ